MLKRKEGKSLTGERKTLLDKVKKREWEGKA